MNQQFEAAYWRARISSLWQPTVPVLPFIPTRHTPPARVLQVSSSWRGIENVLEEIMERFHVSGHRCLEFGVEYGFSTAALSSFFESTIGVDTFQGDIHTNNIKDICAETVQNLSAFPDIQLVKSTYQDYIRGNNETFDLIHVDIIHTYVDTFACGLWSAQHSACTLFHDTESFPYVKQAVADIARATGKQFYNLEDFYGFGIVV